MIASRERIHRRLLTVVGVLDLLFGLWVLSGDPTGSWGLAVGAIGLGLVFLIAANRDPAQPFRWSVSSLYRLGAGRLSLAALLGMCFLARLIVRLIGR